MSDLHPRGKATQDHAYQNSPKNSSSPRNINFKYRTITIQRAQLRNIIDINTLLM